MIYFFQALSLKVRFLALVLLVFPVLAFQWLLMSAPWALASLKVIGHGAGVPDESFWYTPEALSKLLDAWGTEGRSLYLTILWPTDLGFLLSYGALLTVAVLYLLKKTNPGFAWWYLLPLLPLIASGFDLLENFWLGLSVLSFPGTWDVVAWVAAVCSAGKWVFTVLTAVVLVAGTMGSLAGGALKKMDNVGRE